MIRLKDITKVYKTKNVETPALNGISLDIEDGSWVAVMGTSGSGKSTLLNIIGCMDKPTAGEYYLDDEAVHTASDSALHDIRKRKVSFIFQGFALMNQYTIFENVELPLKIKNIPAKERKKLALKALDAVGIKEQAAKKPGEVSGGQRQRCAIARALASENNMILADEPTGALDANTGKEIMEILKGLHEMGKTIIMVTHDKNIASYAEKLVCIEDGRIV